MWLREGAGQWPLRGQQSVLSKITHMGNFLLFLAVRIRASRLRFVLEVENGNKDWDFALRVEIWASQLRFGPLGWNLGLKSRIWASRLELESEERGDGWT